MFMSKDEAFSDDELDDVENDVVVPMSMVQGPTPVVMSGPYANAGPDGEHRSSAYNERLSRARSALTQQRQNKFTNGGMVMSNMSDRPRTNMAASQPAPIDVLSQEVEEMEMNEQRQLDMEYAHNHHNAQQQRVEQELELVTGQYDMPPAISDSERHGVSHAMQQYGEQPPAEQVPRPVANMAAVIDTSDLRAFLMRPGPQGAMVQCYIQRRKTGLARLFPTYEIFLKDGDQFLLAARKRKKKKSSNYVVSLDRDDLGRHTGSFFGKLRSNFIGTEFTLYDKGVNPEKLDKSQLDGSQIQVRQELGTILYKQNVLGSRGPRKMKVMVPSVNEQGQRKVLRPTSKDETMLERYKAAKNDDDVQILKNKQPKWNDQVGAYVLNFNGRVTRASVKNFQLCNMARDPDAVLMQFGRVGKDSFNMDFQYPLCALQAFGIALSSFDYKIACE
mmetsp:Transcript_47102/g.124187  ORF Transcript_47102/g.124187 Transcript_47102/m.124187 type:complete len:446 (+) Transcript_47102:36-1373(+)